MHVWPRKARSDRPDWPMPVPQASEDPRGPAHFIRAWTDAGNLSGVIRSWDRPSDVLNQGEPVWIEDVRNHDPVDGAAWPITQPGMLVDPFDFDLVLLADLPESVARQSATRRIHKVPFRVKIVAGDFEVIGVLHLFPGQAPDVVPHRLSVLFVPITEARVRRKGALVSNPARHVALVHRYTIRAIHPLDWARPSGPGTRLAPGTDA